MVIANACKLLLGGFLLAQSAAASASDLRLGPGDKLRVKTYDWRPSTSELHEWPAMTGEFAVSAAGVVSLPLAGEIQAANLTTGGLADAIATQLQIKVGLARKPDVAVEVTQYRPFYVLGRVNKPGDYPSHPDLTVLQAISIAGGFLQRADISAFELDRQIDVVRGDIHALTAERIAMLGHQARLEAEIHDSPTLSPPAEFANWAGQAEAKRVLEEEKLLLEARRQALHSQLDALTQTETLLGHEIDAQNDKEKSLDRQIALQKKEMDNVTVLAAKGLVVSSRLLSLEQNLSQFESSRSDTDLLILRAKQDLAKTGRDKADLSDKQRAEDLAELTKLSSEIATNMEKLGTARTLAADYEFKGPKEIADNLADQTPTLQFAISRLIDGKPVVRFVTDDEIVLPGDTLRVERRPAAATASSMR